MMGKSDIIEILIRELGLSPRKAAQVYEAIFAAVRDLLAAGERVTIPGFGSFSIAERAARAGRNPATGEAIGVPAAKVAKFKPAARLREKVGEGPPRAPNGGGRRRSTNGGGRPQGRDLALGAGPPARDVGDKLDEENTFAASPERTTPRIPRRRRTRGGGASSRGRARGEADAGAHQPESGADPGGAPASFPPSAPEGAREIIATIEDRPAGRPLPVGEVSTLAFRVGRPVADNLVAGPGKEIAPGDIPAGGLDTEWTIVSREVELRAESDEVRVEREEDEDGTGVWVARFDLRLPERGESDPRRLGVLPRAAGEARLTALLTARREDRDLGELREVFRKVVVRLAAGEAADRVPAAGVVYLASDDQRAAPRHTNIRPPHEWTTPPGHLALIRIDDQDAFANGILRDDGRQRALRGVRVPWPVAEKQVQGPIDNARAALDEVRKAHTPYLDAIEPDDLDRRLVDPQFPSTVDWSHLPSFADAAHEAAWGEVAASDELFALAAEGFALYRAFFPDDSGIRRWLDAQPRGFRLDVVWRPGSGDWLPDVPWGLMCRRPPRRGQPVDPLDFLGLGFRLAHEAHPVSGIATLGAPAESARANLLYWHDDETGAEARRQRARWQGLGRQVFVPRQADDADRMDQVLGMLASPSPSPVAVLYAFCQADAAKPQQPRLRFGRNWDRDSGVTHHDLGSEALADEPLVFVNACDSAAGSAAYASALTERFAGRRSRGYLGSLTRVPIAFADRFATVFFHLFERRFDPAPLAAGEAFALTKLFFWRHYRNLGGLFYSYVDQYDLYRASESEIQELRAG